MVWLLLLQAESIGRLITAVEPTRGPQVIVMVDAGCPVSQRYRPTLERLQAKYADVTWRLTDDRVLAAALGARTTTEVFVLDKARTLVYRGAVDDQYGIGYSKEAPTRTYLIDALEAVKAGRAPEVTVTTAPGCELKLPAEPSPSAVTYHNRISRLVNRHCVECHRTGGVAPFPLDSIETVKSREGAIRRVLSRGTMPPWFAEGGRWANDRSLPDVDKTDLLAWYDAGAPEGDAADAPLARAFPADWAIGEPDWTTRLPREVEVQAEGVMDYVHVRVPTDFAEDRWVTALEVRPTARDVVHHVLVFIDDGARPRRGQERGFLAAYVPGNTHRDYPDGQAKRLPAGATLLFQIHYTPNGRATRDRTQLGLKFGPAPEREIHTIGISNRRFEIPPGDANFAVTARLRVPADVTLLSLMPHMHYRGKAFRFELGDQRLLDVPRYDFNWQLAYDFAEPRDVPKGETLKLTAWYDNSAANPANPDAAATVRWGDQSTDEMMIGYVEYTRGP